MRGTIALPHHPRFCSGPGDWYRSSAYATRAADTPFSTTDDRRFSGPSASFGPVAPTAGDGGVRGLRYTYAGWGIWYGAFDFDNTATHFATIASSRFLSRAIARARF